MVREYLTSFVASDNDTAAVCIQLSGIHLCVLFRAELLNASP